MSRDTHSLRNVAQWLIIWARDLRDTVPDQLATTAMAIGLLEAQKKIMSAVEIIEQPIPMLLYCPRCKTQHVDAPDESKGWDNPSHRSHLCQTPSCRHVWRPSDIPTTGVRAILTSGERDGSPEPRGAISTEPGKRWIKFVEPANKRCDPQRVFMSEQTAIQCYREAHPEAIDDEKALLDFMAIHWAEFCAPVFS